MPRLQFAPLAFFATALFASAAPAAAPSAPTQAADTVWQDAYLKASNADESDQFGIAVAMSGDTLVVGAGGESSAATGVNGDQTDNRAVGAGAAYVFVRSGSGWVQQAYLKASNAGGVDSFGRAVAIDGDTLVVGAAWEASSATGIDGNQDDNSVYQAGAAYVFRRNAGVWTQEAYLKASNTGQDDYFGHAVAVWGDTIAVGARGEASNAKGQDGDQTNNSWPFSGAVYVFRRSAGAWAQEAYLKADFSGPKDFFGESLAIERDTLLVGASGENSNATGINGNAANNWLTGAGAAYVFVRSGSTWIQEAYLKASNTATMDLFGSQVALHGNTVLVGAAQEDSAAAGVNGDQLDNSKAQAGAAFVFVRNGTTWSQQAYLKASNPGKSDGFGFWLALSADRAAVGAPFENGSSMGANGPDDNKLADAGAAYVFRRTGGEAIGTWAPEAYVKASNSDTWDMFSGDLALVDNLLVVGALQDASAASGVNADPFDNSAPSAGSVHVYDLESPCGAQRYGAYDNVNVADLWIRGGPQAGATATLELTGFPTNGVALLAITSSPASTPFLGGTLLVDPQTSVIGPGVLLALPIVGGAGELAIPFPPSAAGLVIYAQAGKFDTNQPLGVTLSNGLELKVCP